MRIYELNSRERCDIFMRRTRLEDFEPIAEINQDISVCQAIRLKNKLYTVCSKRADNSYAFVEEISFLYEEEELYGEDEIKCPVCGNCVSDSWEYPDYDPNHQCSYCGSIFSYERVNNPTYNMTLKKKGEIANILDISEVQNVENN